VSARARGRATAALCALAVAGCGGSAPASTGAAAPDRPAKTPGGHSKPSDPCDLVPSARAAEILRARLPKEGPVKVTTSSFESEGGGTCTYTWNGDLSMDKSFSITLLRADDLDLAAGEGQRTPIPSVGDEAFESNGNYYARAGDAAVHLVNLQETEDASVAMLKAAAEAL